MNKKAQFYILAAVILLSITFGLFAPRKAVSGPEKTFSLLAGNYISEAPFAANQDSIEDFTLRFYDFALARDSNFEMMYIAVSADNISAMSLMKPAIFINQHSLLFNTSVVFEKEDSVAVSIGTEQYEFNTTEAGLHAIFISQDGGSRHVRIE